MQKGKLYFDAEKFIRTSSYSSLVMYRVKYTELKSTTPSDNPELVFASKNFKPKG
jgi:hypothetical protein